MGNGDGQVTTGPFASIKKWPMAVRDIPRQPDFLMRFFWRPGMLPERWEVWRVLRLVPYDASP